MNQCPCCSTPMLRHVRYSQVYWYCSSCKQEMPNLSDWVQVHTLLNNFRSHSCQVPMKPSETSANSHRYPEETLQRIRINTPLPQRKS